MTRKSKREIENALDDLVGEENDFPDDVDSEVVVVVPDEETGEPINQETGEPVDADDILVADFTESSS